MSRSVQHQQAALQRARSGQSILNEACVLRAFESRGICDVQPRVNVLTFAAWLAVGRCVRKGEHGVRVVTFVSGDRVERDPTTGQETRKPFKRPKAAYVFHVSQTEQRA